MLSSARKVFVRTAVPIRSYSRRSAALKAAGGAHDHHDDHEHHDHPMWEELPFKKSTIGPMLMTALFGGAGLIWFACVFQNRKHGFSKK